jgi:hypothetical protein
MYANFNGRSKHSGVGIFNDENVKEFNFIKIFEDACIYKKVRGSAETYFLTLNVDDISIIGNYVFFLIFLSFR